VFHHGDRNKLQSLIIITQKSINLLTVRKTEVMVGPIIEVVIVQITMEKVPVGQIVELNSHQTLS
jgi:hypothetical protein